MESIKSLMESVAKEAHTVEALRKEKANAEHNIIEAIDKNCREIILPVLKQYSDLLAVIDHSLTTLPVAVGVHNETLTCGLKVFLDGAYIGFRTSDNSIVVGVGQRSRSTGCRELKMSAYWLTAEQTQKTLNELTVKFCDYLTLCAQRLEFTSASLAEELQKLEDVLSKSDTVEHKEDGTVVITIGGKRFTGTLEEE